MSVVISALSHSGKAVAVKALAAQEAGKRSTFLSKKLTVGSWRQTRGRKSVFELRYFGVYSSVSSDMIVDGAL